MKAFSLWLYRWCWRREIENLVRISDPANSYGADYADGHDAGTVFALETLHLKEPK